MVRLDLEVDDFIDPERLIEEVLYINFNDPEYTKFKAYVLDKTPLELQVCAKMIKKNLKE